MRAPNTPFATNLSSSGKETQLRIQNIFQWKKKRPPAILFLFTAMLVLSCCSLVSCQMADEQELIIPSQDEILENGYPTNDRGETYGIQVKDLLDEPDLQLAENADGILGYVRQSEINAPEPSTPEEAVQYTLARRGPIVVNMYLQDGETVIGTFSIG